VPLLLVTAVVSRLVTDRQDIVHATTALADQAMALTDLAVLRTRVFEERRQYETVAQSASLGLSPDAVSSLIGMEVVADPGPARAATDAALAAVPPADRPFPPGVLRSLRADIDASSVSLEDVSTRFSALESGTVASLDGAISALSDRAVEIGDVRLERAVDAMADSVAVASQRGHQIQSLAALWFLGGDSIVPAMADLAQTAELYRRTATRLSSSSVVPVAEAWRTNQATGADFDAAIAVELGGRLGEAPRDPADLRALGRVLGSGLRHYEQLSALPEIAATAVSDRAVARGDEARAQAERATAAAVASVVFALAAALWFGRSIARPLRTLTEQIRRVGDGDLALEPLPLTGPPEIRVASAAFNDVAANLGLLEQKALALAEADFARPAVDAPLPGRLGDALSASMHVLSSSILERQQLQERLQHQATHDALTGLANRRSAIETLTAALARSSRSGDPIALSFLDLDDFKATNDSSGHSVGDQLLQVVAERMVAAARQGDLVARFGGDEFVLIAERVGGAADAMALVRRVLDSISLPITLDGRQHHIRASAGVVLSQPSDDAMTLLAKADQAVYRSKRRAPSAVELYDETLQQALRHHSEVEAALKAMLAAGGQELELEYQPILDATTGEVQSLEALVRWNRPGEGQIRPDRFIPIAEESDLISELDRWVLQAATRQLAAWSVHHEFRRVSVSVNISGRHVTDPSFVENVLSALAQSSVDAHRLVLEITETALVSDFPSAAAQIDAVRALGVQVAVDDFGTGHTGLAHVRTMTVDEIKIDQTFTAELPEVTELVRLVMDLGRHLGVRTVAEGVETAEQAEVLRALGCGLLQGYLFCPALPPKALLHWMQGRSLAGLPSGPPAVTTRG